ncbi:hypothetical protein LHP98_18540 [Rhodobacter sp. Har01]|uniref:hypothetical protein n=1 Tax=Rhodobacter sp. Har01 TaxID=2883999 RepID=UPI001D09875A|nr:hypothetical protein [Rhodobacter sp. Har01]MCB6180121.1 hypothetical protein [Rhodobacter sp. Har01]
MTTVDRLRRCLVAGAAALLAVRPLAPALARAPGDESLSIQVLALFSAPQDAIAAGRAYLAQFPAEADRPHLLANVFGPLPPQWSGADAADPSAGIAAWLARRIAEDLDRADVVFVRGWMLSRTEARLCAIASLA